MRLTEIFPGIDLIFGIKFSIRFADWESQGDIEHTMRHIWKQLADQFKIDTKNLTIKSKHGVWSVYPRKNNPGCNCVICNS